LRLEDAPEIAAQGIIVNIGEAARERATDVCIGDVVPAFDHPAGDAAQAFLRTVDEELQQAHLEIGVFGLRDQSLVTLTGKRGLHCERHPSAMKSRVMSGATRAARMRC
jgi:hypothetical protein